MTQMKGPARRLRSEAVMGFMDKVGSQAQEGGYRTGGYGTGGIDPPRP